MADSVIYAVVDGVMRTVPEVLRPILPVRPRTATVERTMSKSIVIAGQHQSHRTLELEGDINVFLAAELHRCAFKSRKGLSA